jgi:hypothetical protein
MKFLTILWITLLIIPLTVFGALDGTWNVHDGICYANEREVTCKSLPSKINITTSPDQIKLQISSAKGEEVKILKWYGEQSNHVNNSYSFFLHNDVSFHYEAFNYTNRVSDFSWIDGAVLHSNTNMMEIELGDYTQYPSIKTNRTILFLYK